MANPPVGVAEIIPDIDDGALKRPAVLGSMIINGKTTLLVDIFEMTRILNPDWFRKDIRSASELSGSGEKTILFAEDSSFFREKIKGFMEEEHFRVFEAEDGQAAWFLLNEKGDEIDLVVTDLEMPNMDGFELTRKIKADLKFYHLAVVALTSLSTKADMDKGEKAGVDEYLVKLNSEKLMEAIQKRLRMS